MALKFMERIEWAWAQSGSLLCVGLDPELARLPTQCGTGSAAIVAFNKAIVDATATAACAYKPQFAYYAAAGALDALVETIAYIKARYPEKLVILDSKRGDIGATAQQYARESFEVYGADAVTVNPYMGGDTLEPFTTWAEKGVVVLCKTSNPGSGELQDMALADGRKVYEMVAEMAATRWNTHGNLALVVGATWPEQLARVRARVGRMPLLVPGIGAQGGDLAAVMRAGLDDRGTGLLINSSRGILYAGSGADYAAAAGAAAHDLNAAINALR